MASAQNATPTQSATPATATTDAPPINAETASAKDIEATKRAENAKYAVDAAVGVAGSAISATASVAASGAAIVGEISKRALGGVNAANPETKKKVVGSLVLIVVLVTIIFGAKALFFTSSPESVIKEFFTALAKGETEILIKYLYESPETATLARENKKFHTMVTKEVADVQSKGGISSIDSKCTKDGLSENQQKCIVTLTFGNSTFQTYEMILRKTNGSWNIALI